MCVIVADLDIRIIDKSLLLPDTASMINLSLLGSIARIRRALGGSMLVAMQVVPRSTVMNTATLAVVMFSFHPPEKTRLLQRYCNSP